MATRRAAIKLLSLDECKSIIDQSGPCVSRDTFVIITDSVTTVVQSGEEVNMEKLAVIVECLKKAVVLLFNEIDTLQDEVKLLKDKLSNLEIMEENLLIGQVAAKAEKEILIYLLRDTGHTDDDYVTIGQVQNACEMGSKSRLDLFSGQEIEQLNKNWDDLAAIINSLTVPDKKRKITIGHLLAAIYKFKTSRNKDAHQDIEVDEALQRLQEIDTPALLHPTSHGIDHKTMAIKLAETLKKLSVKKIGTYTEN